MTWSLQGWMVPHANGGEGRREVIPFLLLNLLPGCSAPANPKENNGAHLKQ